MGTSEDVRLDVWLDIACLFRTRSEAQKACRLGKIAVNRQPGKPHRLVRVGDRLEIARPFGRTQIVIIRTLADRHMPKAEARQLYDDQTPPPAPEELDARRAERLFRAAAVAAGTPDRRARRQLRALKGKG